MGNAGNSNAGKLIVVGLVVVSIALFVVFLPGATRRVLGRLERVVPLLVVAALGLVAFVVVRVRRK